MRKLALSDEELLSVERPARYIGGEMNSACKIIDGNMLRFVMCFPDVYEIGMSHIGIQILYDMFNRREDVFCERLFSPWIDLDKLMREKDIPLFSLESQLPVREADFLGITLQYEMCYTNILQILDLSKIPIHAAERDETDPIVIGGGPCAYNPEPLAEFFDMFYIGEGEVRYDELFELYKSCKKEGKSRVEFLRQASQIEGLYVPLLYKTDYDDEGLIKSFAPLYEAVPEVIRRQVVTEMDEVNFINKPVVPFIKVTQDRVVLELIRGCIDRFPAVSRPDPAAR